MNKLLVALALGGSLAPRTTILGQAAAAKPAETPLARDVDRVIEAQLRERTFAGAAVGIAHNGRITFLRGYGLADVENGVPVTENTVFRIGSITKQFTAAGILRLVDRGQLSLDDPLAKFLPDFPRASEVTIRQLLSHTSGISSYTDPKVVKDPRDGGRREWTTEAMIGHIARLDPAYEFDPGTGWSYSNSGYVVLGAVIEKISGKPYHDFLKSEILDPLELHETTVDDLAEIVPHRARGYDPAKDTRTSFANADFISMSAAGAAGAMRSTLADLLKWHTALFGGRVIQPATLAQMTAPAHLKDGRLSSLGRRPPFWVPASTEYGFGLFLDQIEGHRAIGHGGAINGFNAWMETFPDQHLTIVVLANTSYPAAEHTGPNVAHAVMKAFTTP